MYNILMMQQEDLGINNRHKDHYNVNTTCKEDYAEFIKEEEIITETEEILTEAFNDYEINLLFQDLPENVSINSLTFS